MQAVASPRWQETLWRSQKAFQKGEAEARRALPLQGDVHVRGGPVTWRWWPESGQACGPLCEDMSVTLSAVRERPRTPSPRV